MNRLRQRGVALPIALIMFFIMIVSALYMLRRSSSTTAMASNLSYQRTVVQATDFGLETAHLWLTTTASTNKALLDQNSPANGYVASYPYLGPNQPATYTDTQFWNGSVTVNFTDAIGNATSIEYVIHRYCTMAGAYNASANSCVLSSTAASTQTGVVVGTSAAADTEALDAPSRVHYLITARLIGGARGASSINETVVMIGT